MLYANTSSKFFGVKATTPAKKNTKDPLQKTLNFQPASSKKTDAAIPKTLKRLASDDEGSGNDVAAKPVPKQRRIIIDDDEESPAPADVKNKDNSDSSDHSILEVTEAKAVESVDLTASEEPKSVESNEKLTTEAVISIEEM